VQRVKFFIEKRRTELKPCLAISGSSRPEDEFVLEYVRVIEANSEAIDVLQAEVKISIGVLRPTLNFLLRLQLPLTTLSGEEAGHFKNSQLHASALNVGVGVIKNKLSVKI
jgi:hypothetical protein